MQSSFKSEIGGHCYSMPMWFGDNAKPVLMHMLLDICCIFDIFWTSCTSFFFFAGGVGISWLFDLKGEGKQEIRPWIGTVIFNWFFYVGPASIHADHWRRGGIGSPCLELADGHQVGKIWWSGPSNYGSQSLIVISVTFKTANSQFVSCNWVFTNSKACISRSS